jgi:hypothetical protein
MIPFALTIFLSAFLLFQVQPLISRFILPWFGGGPAVWATCMVFFQVVLLAGYGYAHLASERLPRRKHVWLHLALLALSLLMLPIVPDQQSWGTASTTAPEPRILLLLAVTVGMPYWLLSSTAPLVQRWYSEVWAGRAPYRLYALSNAGSLLALLSYPVLVEPVLRLEWQASLWSAAYVVFAALSGWTALSTMSLSATGLALPQEQPAEPGALSGGEGSTGAPGVGVLALWLALSACGSALFLATTNQMCQEVSVVPFLWVLPLAIYLLTFIFCFEHERWYRPIWFGVPLAVLVPATCALIAAGLDFDLRIHILVYAVTLFAACMVCHGELALAKPHPRHLTLFYLVVAAGGALGGIFVALAAPRIFSGYWEYPLALGTTCALAVLAWLRSGLLRGYADHPIKKRILVTGMAAAFLSAAVFVWTNARREVVLRTRNFYGVLRVTNHVAKDGEQRVLTHGNTLHGSQWLDDEKRTWPTTYYGNNSGIGLALDFHPRRLSADSGERTLQVGAVGLGAGTIAALASSGDHIRFYEINPAVKAISEQYFTFRQDSLATTEVVLGDARMRLDEELREGVAAKFDVLAVDAFNSDAIPIHLLTREAVDIYWRRLAPDGLLLFHISNHSLDLAPIVRAHAEYLGGEAIRIVASGDEAKDTNYNTWVVVTKNRAFLDSPDIQKAIDPWTEEDAPPLVWTDDFAGLWHVLKF